jgi:hypothetical protein
VISASRLSTLGRDRRRFFFFLADGCRLAGKKKREPAAYAIECVCYQAKSCGGRPPAGCGRGERIADEEMQTGRVFSHGFVVAAAVDDGESNFLVVPDPLLWGQPPRLVVVVREARCVAS